MPKAFLDKQLDSIADARAVEISPAMLERGRLIWNDIMSRSDKPRYIRSAARSAACNSEIVSCDYAGQILRDINKHLRNYPSWIPNNECI